MHNRENSLVAKSLRHGALGVRPSAEAYYDSVRDCYASLGCENEKTAGNGRKISRLIGGLLASPWRDLCFARSMRTDRFLVSDLDEDITARFRNADYAVRFARWLARGRCEELSVVVSDEARSGSIVWTEPQPSSLIGSSFGVPHPPR